ncbi:MAG TPA: peptidylprolyl isomerase [Rhizomicrobium sp.]|jgi:cyclophilin family peptidyl-prolyl cis-trans isomerase
MRCLSLAVAVAAFFVSGALAQTAPQIAAGPQATIETSLGAITVALDPVHAPLTVANFIRYAKEKHFDGTVIYRVVPGFVLQMGSYEADGKPRRTHAPIPLEANNGLSNVRGTLAMAHGDMPASATAEFFINLSDNSASLNHEAGDTGDTTGFAVFGQVTSGMDVADKIAAVALGGVGPFANAAPVTPVVIEKVTIAEAPQAPSAALPADTH